LVSLLTHFACFAKESAVLYGTALYRFVPAGFSFENF
jgi:hypothetical protein